jgi:hypothetical protein
MPRRLLTVRKLMVAAGGGGDAITAAALSAATPGDCVGIASLAWDRLIVDPLPGPRSADEFTGLVGRPGYHLVNRDTRTKPPAGSALPRLARELRLPLVMLDPSGGAVGIQLQLAAVVIDLGVDVVHLVDVGGDILGRPGDNGLRSPLADALMAAGVTGLPADVWIAGAGLDGELAETLVLQRISPVPPLLTLSAPVWSPFMSILEWHPSEATALLAAASHGLRGLVEIRDAGLPVSLTDLSAGVYRVPLANVSATNPLVDALAETTTFAQVEEMVRDLLGWTELDAERTKAASMGRTKAVPANIQTALPQWEADALDRGLSYVTFRRLAEVLHQPNVGDLRENLVRQRPEKYARPLWRL